MFKFAFVLICLTAVASAHADTPGKHPAYEHAMSDLHTAIWHLEHRGGSQALQTSDQQAVGIINQAIGAISQAASSDQKTPHEFKPQGRDHTGDVHRARELVEKALKDISGQESNPAAQGAQGQAIQLLNQALQQLNQSLAVPN